MTEPDGPPDPGVLTLDEAAGRLGVHYMTAYRYLRIGRLAAEQRDGRWMVPTEEVERLARTSPPRARRRRSVAMIKADQSERLLRRLIAGDGPGSWTVIEAALATSSPTDIYLQVLAPAMRRLGEQWVDGTISVGDEHRATSVAMRIVGRLSPLFSRPGRHRPGTVVLAGAGGDPHVIPCALVVDVLRSDGFSVVDLGADVPARSVIEAVESRDDVIAVGLSLSAAQYASSVTDTIADVRRDHPDLAVLAGGPALDDRASALGLGASHWAGDAAAVVELVKDLSQALTATLRPAPRHASR